MQHPETLQPNDLATFEFKGKFYPGQILDLPENNVYLFQPNNGFMPFEIDHEDDTYNVKFLTAGISPDVTDEEFPGQGGFVSMIDNMMMNGNKKLRIYMAKLLEAMDGEGHSVADFKRYMNQVIEETIELQGEPIMDDGE